MLKIPASGSKMGALIFPKAATEKVKDMALLFHIQYNRAAMNVNE